MDAIAVRPEMTMPAAEAAHLRAAYAEAGVILEYGSGGSTVIAAEMTGKTVFAVEKDRRWIGKMREWLIGHPGTSTIHFHLADIGPTRRWGRPKDEAQWRSYAGYPLDVWDRPDFVHPDVVLIDGRFRVGCFLATILRIARPVTVLFDDYRPRKSYRAVEEWFAPQAMIGRMAHFDVSPVALNPACLRRMFDLMQDPT